MKSPVVEYRPEGGGFVPSGEEAEGERKGRGAREDRTTAITRQTKSGKGQGPRVRGRAGGQSNPWC